MGKLKLTPRQRQLLELIEHTGSIRCYTTPGREHQPVGCYLGKKGDHRDLDGRTVASFDKRGLIQLDGGNYIISQKGRDALREVRQSASDAIAAVYHGDCDGDCSLA
jgi:hypothetical protein